VAPPVASARGWGSAGLGAGRSATNGAGAGADAADGADGRGAAATDGGGSDDADGRCCPAGGRREGAVPCERGWAASGARRGGAERSVVTRGGGSDPVREGGGRHPARAGPQVGACSTLPATRGVRSQKPREHAASATAVTATRSERTATTCLDTTVLCRLPLKCA
jgi:hypothetical protein